MAHAFGSVGKATSFRRHDTPLQEAHRIGEYAKKTKEIGHLLLMETDANLGDGSRCKT